MIAYSGISSWVESMKEVIGVDISIYLIKDASWEKAYSIYPVVVCRILW